MNNQLNPDSQGVCEHEYEAIDAGPYSDDIFYEVCKKCHHEKPDDPQGGESNMTNEDKSEGVAMGVFAVVDPSPLPIDEKFTLWLDDEGDYMIQSQREAGLQAHAATPEDAVYVMRQVLDMAASLGDKPTPLPEGATTQPTPASEAKEITWVPVYVERAICDLLPEAGYAREIARVAWAWDDEHPGHENSLFRWQNEAIRQRRDLIALQELIEHERGSTCQYCSDYGCQSCISLAQPVPSAGSKPQEEGGSEEQSEVGCMDCGRSYPHGLDMVLTKKQWLMVHPDDGGVLCPSCIVNRAEKLPKAIAVYAHVVLGDHYDEDGSLENMLVAIRLENSDYAREIAEFKYQLSSQPVADGGGLPSGLVQEIEKHRKELIFENLALRELLSEAIHMITGGFHKRRLNLKLVELDEKRSLLSPEGSSR